MTSAVWDPLSRNPYRLLGVTTEGDVDWADIHPQPIFQAPGLEVIEPTPELISDALAALANPDHLPYYRATWFSAPRAVDQVAYADVCRGRLQEAWHRWEQDGQPVSRQNLAILAHIRWLYRPEDPAALLECARRWRELYDETQAPGDAAVLAGFVEWTRQEAYRSLTAESAAQVQQALQLLGVLAGAPEVARFEAELLKDDREKATMALASLREQLLSDAAVAQVTTRFESEALPLLNFVMGATLPDTPLFHDMKRDLCLFYRLLARSWHRHGQKLYGEAWMEKALETAPPDLRDEISSELEHWRVTRVPVQATAFSQTSVDPEKRVRVRVGILLVMAAVCVLLVFWWQGRRPEPLPWGRNLTRAAAQKRVDSILDEISPLAARLAELSREIRETANATRRQQLQTEYDAVKDKHEKLKSELIRLQQWLDTQP